MYRKPSPAPSTTSFSDNDDDDLNKSTYFAISDALVVSPAQWSSKIHQLSAADTQDLPHSPISRLPPEILIHLLKHLHSPRDMYNCLLVSRTWCECSIELLWHKPSFSKLSTLVKMMRVLSRGDQTFTYARFIRRLNFLFLGSDLTDSLFSRLSQCDRLERLTLVNCAMVTDDALSRVLPCCPNLVAIDLTGVSDTSDKAIVGLASAARRLQGINLGGCKKVTDIGVFALAANCPLLRRVKLSGVELVTDGPVSALARSCPLLLEIDLNNCKYITDISVRDIWKYSTHMREMRLSHCVELTNAAFPAPYKSDTTPPSNTPPNPFPSLTQSSSDQLPPLVLSRTFEHLRMLDLTACALITDDAVDGIISHAPKIRNLVLSKCVLLTDTTVENICKLGKHIHYLHLGHAALITDRSVRTLARCCTRLRYIDFANCTLLTDMSVFELSSLPKLRRIGLVRVNNLTDEAIYALANRDATLERIHLSYCDQITVMAIHFLLQKLNKLTHLSLTGIPAFRKTELQQFCRAPPPEFNMSQRAAFCVYSGKGVAELRTFLLDLFDQITEEINAAEGETEYDDDGYDQEEAYREVTPDGDMEAGNEGDDDEDYVPAHRVTFHHPHPNLTVYRGNRQSQSHPLANGQLEPTTSRDRSARGSHAPPMLTQQQPTADRSMTVPPVASTSNGAIRTNGMTIPHTVPRRTRGGFGHQPVVETSISPEPSEVASNRSTGTNQSNGAGFFRTYQEAAIASSSRSNGAQTPDLIFAEIGHGRGAGHNARTDSVAGLSSHGISQVIHSSGSQIDTPTHTRPEVLADSSNSYRPVTWPHVHRELSTPSPSSSPRTRELHDSVQSALGTPHGEGREGEGRGRSVKRSLRNTFQVAEHLASSFLFGSRQPNGHSRDGSRPPNGVPHDDYGSSGTSTGMDSGQSEPARRGRQG